MSLFVCTVFQLRLYVLCCAIVYCTWCPAYTYSCLGQKHETKRPSPNTHQAPGGGRPCRLTFAYVIMYIFYLHSTLLIHIQFGVLDPLHTRLTSPRLTSPRLVMKTVLPTWLKALTRGIVHQNGKRGTTPIPRPSLYQCSARIQTRAGHQVTEKVWLSGSHKSHTTQYTCLPHHTTLGQAPFSRPSLNIPSQSSRSEHPGRFCHFPRYCLVPLLVQRDHVFLVTR